MQIKFSTIYGRDESQIYGEMLNFLSSAKITV